MSKKVIFIMQEVMERANIVKEAKVIEEPVHVVHEAKNGMNVNEEVISCMEEVKGRQTILKELMNRRLAKVHRTSSRSQGCDEHQQVKGRHNIKESVHVL